MGSEAKSTIRAWKTIGWMKKGPAKKPAQSAILEKMSLLELAVAANNPDHHADARAEAQKLLVGRGGRVDGNVIPLVPGFVPVTDVDGLRRRFFGASRNIRKWMGWLIFLGFLVALVGVGFAEELKRPTLREAHEAGLITQEEFYNYDRSLTTEEYEAAREEGVEFESAFPSDATLQEVLLHRFADQTPSGRRYEIANSIGQVFIAVFVVAWFSWMLFSFLRRNPARLLLLRKFNDKALSKSMGWVISSELRPFGHIATLSDMYIRRSRWSWIGRLIPTNFLHVFLIVLWFPIRFVLRRFNKARYGPPYVGSARDFRNLAKRLRDRVGLNVEVAMTSKEAFMVRTHDDWWKHVVALLMNSADVIVVDLSSVASGTLWELERLDRLKMFERAVLVAREDTVASARDAVAGFDAARARTVFAYDKFGDMADRQGFRTAMLETMAYTLMEKSRVQIVS